MKAIFLILGTILFESMTSTYALGQAISPSHDETHVGGDSRVLVEDDLGDDFDDDNFGEMGGYRALRGLGEQDNDNDNDDNGDDDDNDEVVVAGRTVVRGGAVVAPPRPRRWY
ncbi:hypothetical protein Plhal703r1_c27g0111681 [Plasmopara halstedii]